MRLAASWAMIGQQFLYGDITRHSCQLLAGRIPTENLGDLSPTIIRGSDVPARSEHCRLSDAWRALSHGMRRSIANDGNRRLRRLAGLVAVASCSRRGDDCASLVMGYLDEAILRRALPACDYHPSEQQLTDADTTLQSRPEFGIAFNPSAMWKSPTSLDRPRTTMPTLTQLRSPDDQNLHRGTSRR